jgi:hypothetical protein
VQAWALSKGLASISPKNNDLNQPRARTTWVSASISALRQVVIHWEYVKNP